MGILGILTCEILELEFAHILGTDTDLGGITVLDDERSSRLIEALESLNVKQLKRIADLKEFHEAWYSAKAFLDSHEKTSME